MSGADHGASPGGASPDPIPASLATYTSAFFSLSSIQMLALAAPLLVAERGFAPALAGIVLGARAVLALVYSIHIGALIDQIGIRRVMISFAVAGAGLTLAYPFVVNPWLLMLLQLCAGVALTTGWLCAQSAVAQTARGSARQASHFAFATTAGMCLGPLLVGLVWDGAGTTWAFVLIAIWTLALCIAAAMLPVRPSLPKPVGLHLRDAIPRISAYRAALLLLRNAAVAFVLWCTFLRLALFSIHESFYAVFLTRAGYSNAEIGTLVAAAFGASLPAALAAGTLVRLTRSTHGVMIGAILLSAVTIAATPLLPSYPALLVAGILFGIGNGLGFPLMLSMLSGSVSPAEQGLSIGLRGTINRMAAVMVPVTMGLVAEASSIAWAFWSMSGALALGAVGAIWIHRRIKF